LIVRKEGFRQLRHMQHPGSVAASGGGSWVRGNRDGEFFTGGECLSGSSSSINVALHATTGGSRPKGLGGRRVFSIWEGSRATGAERTAPTCPTAPERHPCVESLLEPTPHLEWTAFQVRCTKSFPLVDARKDACPPAPG
jgi:hypothetical protein